MEIPIDVFVRSSQYSAMVLSVVPRIFNWFREPVTLSKPVARIRIYYRGVRLVVKVLKSALTYICFDKFVLGLNPFWFYLFDRIGVDINDVYMVLVNNFVKPHFKAVALRSERMRFDVRSQHFLLLWVF